MPFFQIKNPKKHSQFKKKKPNISKAHKTCLFFKSRILQTPKDFLFEKKDCVQNISSTFGGIFTSPH
ncbi:MAG TPA: hypothetical protein DCE42_11110, partial [Myxococcales bacterium]|nr:hypothetical protein [Myxococcales bacterium]